MARIGIIIPDEMRDQLEEIAQEQDRNLSWIVRKALQQYIDGQQRCQAEEE